MEPNKPSAPAAPADPQVAPAPNQKVQYVITQQSLNGIGGWLLFFMVVFGVVGIAEIGIFFSGLESGVNTPSDTLAVIFAPILAVGYLASLVLMAMRKKIALLFVYGAIGASALYSTLAQLLTNDNGENSVTMKVSGIIVGLVMYGLWALYFRQSRRVKETLLK